MGSIPCKWTIFCTRSKHIDTQTNHTIQTIHTIHTHVCSWSRVMSTKAYSRTPKGNRHPSRIIMVSPPNSYLVPHAISTIRVNNKRWVKTRKNERVHWQERQAVSPPRVSCVRSNCPQIPRHKSIDRIPSCASRMY